MVTRAAKDLLRNTIRNTDYHNKLLQEHEMWKSWEVEKGLTMMITDAEYLRRRMALEEAEGAGPHLRMDSEQSRRSRRRKATHQKELRQQKQAAKLEMEIDSRSTYWTRRLMKVEEADPDRWGHAGYKELYPEEFESGSNKSSPLPPKHKIDKAKGSPERKKKRKKYRRERSPSEDRRSRRSRRRSKKSKHKSRSSRRHRESSSDSSSSRSRSPVSRKKYKKKSRVKESSSSSSSPSQASSSPSRSRSKSPKDEPTIVAATTADQDSDTPVMPFYSALRQSGSILSQRFNSTHTSVGSDDDEETGVARPVQFMVNIPTSSMRSQKEDKNETLSQKRDRLLKQISDDSNRHPKSKHKAGLHSDQ